MARPNFFAENKHRTFPFLEDFQELREVSSPSLSLAGIYDMQLLPNDAVVDFGCDLNVRSDYGPDTTVFLAEVRRAGGFFVFEFRCTSTELTDKVLLFSRKVDSDDWETEYQNHYSLAVEPSLGPCLTESTSWEGYLVTGTMESLRQILPSDGDKLKGPTVQEVLDGDRTGAIVEPALVRAVSASYLNSLNLANADRTRAENPEECQPLRWPFTVQPIYIRNRCLRGNIRFVEGYNMVIDQETGEEGNRLTLNAVVGGGQGEPCEEVSLFADDQPPRGGSLLTGGPKCTEVIRTINGVGGRVVDLLSGPGVLITSEPENHRIIIDFDMGNLALCYDDEPFEQSLCPEESVSQSFCGPA